MYNYTCFLFYFLIVLMLCLGKVVYLPSNASKVAVVVESCDSFLFVIE